MIISSKINKFLQNILNKNEILNVKTHTYYLCISTCIEAQFKLSKDYISIAI